MDNYTTSAQRASKVVTETFSTSFSSAITLFSKDIQQDIYNIYGLVRVADEVVDTYQGPEAAQILDELEKEVYATLERGFSANVIVHAFGITARTFAIDQNLIAPFFASMRMDLTTKRFTTKEYQTYIYGSAEVVGLMCLKVFTQGSKTTYQQLAKGASALGAAFQKVNFLRDIKDDYQTRGRYYFPTGSFDTFGESEKTAIIAEIQKDFTVARLAIAKLPDNARFATQLAYDYYRQLLKTLQNTPADQIRDRRIRVSRAIKLRLLIKSRLRSYVG